MGPRKERDNGALRIMDGRVFVGYGSGPCSSRPFWLTSTPSTLHSFARSTPIRMGFPEKARVLPRLLGLKGWFIQGGYICSVLI
jgi:hypothetical protein